MLQQATHTNKHRALEIYTYVSLFWTENLVDYNKIFYVILLWYLVPV